MNRHSMEVREGNAGELAIAQPNGHLPAWDYGVRRELAHSTPDPDAEPPRSIPDDIPPPAHAPVQEPTLPEPPIKADKS